MISNETYGTTQNWIPGRILSQAEAAPPVKTHFGQKLLQQQYPYGGRPNKAVRGEGRYFPFTGR